MKDGIDEKLVWTETGPDGRVNDRPLLFSSFGSEAEAREYAENFDYGTYRGESIKRRIDKDRT